jgi:hypothetical protein
MKKEEEKETLHDESTELRKLEGTRVVGGGGQGERGPGNEGNMKTQHGSGRKLGGVQYSSSSSSSSSIGV